MHDVRYDWLCANKNFPCLSYPGGIWLSGTTDAVVACILPFSFSLIKKALGVALVNGDWDVSGLLVTKMEIWRSSLCLGDQRLYIIPKEIFWIFELGEYVLTLLHCQCLWSFMIYNTQRKIMDIWVGWICFDLASLSMPLEFYDFEGSMHTLERLVGFAVEKRVDVLPCDLSSC